MIHWHFKHWNDLTKYQLYEILKIRLEVFAVEQEIAYQDCDDRDFQSFHLFATKGQEMVAYTRIIPPKIAYEEPSLGRVLTSINHRGKGLGKKLIYLALQTIETQFSTKNCKISAQLYLKSFYESFGFETVSEVYTEEGLPHIKMLKKED